MAWPACPWGRVWTQIRAAAIVMFLFAHKSIATDCNFLQGCQSCSTQQPQLRAPILPGYKGTPISTSRQAQITAKYSQEVDPKTRLPVTAASDTDTQPEAAGTLQPVAADSSSPSRKARVLLRDARTEASALYVSQATQAESQISGYSLSDAVHTNMQQSKPPANSVATVASAAATGASAAEISSDSPRIVHAADATGPTVVGPAMGPSPVPLVLAPPALDAVRSNEDHPVYPAAADQQSQALSILTADPKASGPHPWDVLLFKTNQFNTTRPAYRLGGLGLMLMADFNKSRPLTDWHAVAVQPQQQQQQQQVNVKSTFNKASSDSSSGQGHGVLGQLGQMMKQAVQNNGKPAAAVHLEAGQILKPPSLVEQLKSILQKLGKAKTNASADKDAVFSIASVDGPKRLWCTACESPAYRLSEFGTCGKWPACCTA